jgi:hypothetical protein
MYGQPTSADTSVVLGTPSIMGHRRRIHYPPPQAFVFLQSMELRRRLEAMYRRQQDRKVLAAMTMQSSSDGGGACTTSCCCEECGGYGGGETTSMTTATTASSLISSSSTGLTRRNEARWREKEICNIELGY